MNTNDFRDVTADELNAVVGGTVTLEDLQNLFEMFSRVLKASNEIKANLVSNIR